MKNGQKTIQRLYCFQKEHRQNVALLLFLLSFKVKAVVVHPKELINEVGKEKNKPVAALLGSVPDE